MRRVRAVASYSRHVKSAVAKAAYGFDPRVVRVVITAFDEATRFFPARKIEKLGNPVRKAIVAALENVGDT
jgi:hypothetical protein